MTGRKASRRTLTVFFGCPALPVLVSVTVLQNPYKPVADRHQTVFRRADVKRSACSGHNPSDKPSFVPVRTALSVWNIRTDNIPVHAAKDTFCPRGEFLRDDAAGIAFPAEPRSPAHGLCLNVVAVREVFISLIRHRADAGRVVLMVLEKSELCAVILRPPAARALHIAKSGEQESLDGLPCDIHPRAVAVRLPGDTAVQNVPDAPDPGLVELRRMLLCLNGFQPFLRRAVPQDRVAFRSLLLP